jgi:hypothetical protein
MSDEIYLYKIYYHNFSKMERFNNRKVCILMVYMIEILKIIINNIENNIENNMQIC